MTFAKLEDKFTKADCKFVGLFIDGLYSHIGWLGTIEDKIKFKDMENMEIKLPLIEDISMEVAKKYGMIQPGESKTQAVRLLVHRDVFRICYCHFIFFNT